jgi:hypothetical protein
MDKTIRTGNTVKVKDGAYEELSRRGWLAEYIPKNLNGMSAKVVADYRDAPQPHLAINVGNSIDEIGVPEEYLEAV